MLFRSSDRGDAPNEMGNNLPYVRFGGGRKAKSLALGVGFSCALLDNATVKCWGKNDVGQLGLGDTAWDLIVLDVTDAPASRLRPGAVAELLGEQITVDDMGARAGTISSSTTRPTRAGAADPTAGVMMPLPRRGPRCSRRRGSPRRPARCRSRG